MSSRICARLSLPVSAISALESIAALLASADVLLSSADSSGMPGSMSTKFGEPQ
jgi:hypothetical protein